MELDCPVCRKPVSVPNDAIDTDWACPFCQEMFVPRAVLTNVGHPKLTLCSDCGHVVSRRASTCATCGVQLVRPTPSARGCPDCGKQVAADARICPNCGGPILLRPIPTEPTATQRPIPLNRAGERASAREKRNNPWALTGFILGCCSIPLSIIGILSIAAVVCSIVGVTQFDEERHTNKWMGPLGIVLGCLGFLANLAAYGYLG